MTYKIVHEYFVRPAFSDMDGYGCAHHSRYWIWFENARFSIFFDKFHMSEEILRKYMFPISDVHCKYYEPVKFGYDLVVRTVMEVDDEVPLLKFHYRTIRVTDGKLMSKGQTTHVITDMEHNILSGIPSEISNVLKNDEGEKECL